MVKVIGVLSYVIAILALLSLTACNSLQQESCSESSQKAEEEWSAIYDDYDGLIIGDEELQEHFDYISDFYYRNINSLEYLKNYVLTHFEVGTLVYTNDNEVMEKYFDDDKKAKEIVLSLGENGNFGIGRGTFDEGQYVCLAGLYPLDSTQLTCLVWRESSEMSQSRVQVLENGWYIYRAI